jgi:ribonuclease G
MLCEACPYCQGKGHVKTSRTVAYDILREILREARQFNPKQFRIVASPQVVDLLLDEESSHVASLSDFIGKPITVQSDTAMGQEQFDVVLV